MNKDFIVPHGAEYTARQIEELEKSGAKVVFEAAADETGAGRDIVSFGVGKQTHPELKNSEAEEAYYEMNNE